MVGLAAGERAKAVVATLLLLLLLLLAPSGVFEFAGIWSLERIAISLESRVWLGMKMGDVGMPWRRVIGRRCGRREMPMAGESRSDQASTEKKNKKKATFVLPLRQ